MSQLLPLIYQLDTTGVSPDNKIANEPHTLAAKKVRALAPLHSPFFKDSVIIKDSSNNRTLANTEYKFYSLQALASAMYGKEIYNIVLITNPAVSSNVSITYQTLGGEYNRVYESTKDLLDQLYSDNRPVTWPNIEDEPESFNPVHHLHAVGDTIGFEYVVAALERLRTVIMTSALMQSDKILEYVEAKLSALNDVNVGLVSTVGVIENQADDFITHISDFNNPHNTDKAQVGLGNLLNYTVATKADIVTPVAANPKYVTNIALKDYLNDFFITYNASINAEFNALNNSLNTLTTKVNLNQNTIDSLASSQTKLNTTNTQYASLVQQMNSIQANISDATNRAALIAQQYSINFN